MAGRKIGEAFVRVRPDTKGFLKDADGDVTRAGHSLGGGFAGAFTKAFGVITVALGSVLAVGKAVSILKEGIAGARDLAETQSAVNVIFGESAAQVHAFATNAVKELGQTRNQALGAANTFATFGKSAGLTGPELVRFSTKLVSLSADLASFKNTSPEEAIMAIGAALRGESEPIRRYGILLDDATLKNRALKEGIIDQIEGSLTPQQRVLAAQAEIFAQTADAQGDFQRTSGGLANQQRITTAALAEFKTKIGDIFLPAVTAVTKYLNDTFVPILEQKVIPAIRAARDWFANEIVPVLRDKLLPAVRDEIIPKLQQLGRTVMEDIVPALRDFWTWINEHVVPVIEGFYQKLTPVLLGFKDLGKVMGDNQEQFKQTWDLLKVVVTFLVDVLGPVVGVIIVGHFIALKGILAGLIITFGAIVRAVDFTITKMRELGEWVFNLGKTVGEFTQWAGGALTEAGRNLVRGLWEGVRSLGGWLWDRITQFVKDNVPGPVAKILGIASPSKLFAEFGRNTIRGFVIGIDAEAGNLVKAISSAVAVRPPTVPAAATSAAGTGGAVQNIFNLTGPSVPELAAQVRRELAWTQGG